MNGAQGYSLSAYGGMIANLPRMEAYVQALRQNLRAGDVLLDIGSGPGAFALLACQFGARKVYALEPDDAILAAVEIARANGFGEKIQFIQGLSTSISLPEKADLIISDLRGTLPLFEHHIPAIIDARQRFLAPGGMLIPQKDTLYMAVVENPEIYKEYTSPWSDQPFGLDMQPVLKYVLNCWRKTKTEAGQLLSVPRIWACLDYRSIKETNVQAEAGLEIQRAGTAHGLAIWFDAELVEGIGFSNAPGQPALVYGQAFFPFLRPLEVHAGEMISVNLRADLVGRDYEWTWRTSLQRSGQPENENPDFTQSTFYQMPISPTHMRKMAASHIAKLSPEGMVRRFILDLMDGSHPLEEIVRLSVDRFPEYFPDWKSALTLAGELSVKYGQ